VEIVGGALIKIGCPAFAELAATIKHAKTAVFMTKSSFSRTFLQMERIL
jgi:hypothetical protein